MVVRDVAQLTQNFKTTLLVKGAAGCRCHSLYVGQLPGCWACTALESFLFVFLEVICFTSRKNPNSLKGHVTSPQTREILALSSLADSQLVFLSNGLGNSAANERGVGPVVLSHLLGLTHTRRFTSPLMWRLMLKVNYPCHVWTWAQLKLRISKEKVSLDTNYWLYKMVFVRE